jgi:hypothetical protein
MKSLHDRNWENTRNNLMNKLLGLSTYFQGSCMHGFSYGLNSHKNQLVQTIAFMILNCGFVVSAQLILGACKFENSDVYCFCIPEIWYNFILISV